MIPLTAKDNKKLREMELKATEKNQHKKNGQRDGETKDLILYSPDRIFSLGLNPLIS